MWRLTRAARRHNRRRALAGMLRGLLLMLVVCWLWFVFDRIFRPGITVRFLLLLAVAGVALQIVVRQLRRVLRRPNPVAAAREYEKQCPELQDLLLTAVTVRDADVETPVAQSLLHVTQEEALKKLAPLPPAILDRKFYLRRWLVLLLVPALLTGVLIVRHGPVARLWTVRCLLMANAPIPTLSRLYAPDFNQDGILRVARGESQTVTIWADQTAKRVPDRILLTPEAAHRRAVVRTFKPRLETVQGCAVPVRVFSHTFENVQESFGLVVEGSDSRIESLLVLCCERPELGPVTAEITLPEYLKRAAVSQPVLSELAVLAGSSLRLTIGCEPGLTLCADSGRVTGSVIDFGDQLPGEVEFYLADEYGITSHRRHVKIKQLADKEPEITAEILGLGSFITRRAKGLCRGRVTDDFGLGPVAFRVRVKEDVLPESFTLTRGKGQITEYEFKSEFDFSSVPLENGDRIELILDASDLRQERDLAAMPTGVPYDEQPQSRRTVGIYEVVTPVELAKILAQRESALRERLLAQTSEVRLSSRNFTGEQRSSALRQVEKEAFEIKHIADSVRQILLEAENNLLFVPESVSLEALMSKESGLADDWFLSGEYKSRLTDNVLTPLESLVTGQFPLLLASLDTAGAAETDSDVRGRAPALFNEIIMTLEQVATAMNQVNTYQGLLNDFQSLREELHGLSETLRKERQQKLRNLAE